MLTKIAMSSQIFAGIDVGSASVRTGIFDAKGQRLALLGVARPETKAFHDAKYAVYSPLHQNMEPCRSAMSAWQ